MKCKKCGFILSEGDKFCRSCGTPNIVDGNDIIDDGNRLDNVGVQPTQYAYVPESQYEEKKIAGQQYGNMQQQYGNMQQRYGNPISYQQPEPKKSNVGKIVLIAAACFAACAVMTTVAVSVITKKDDKKPVATQSESGDTITDTVKVGNDSETKPASTYKVNFKNCTFEIPDNMIYEDDITALNICDEEGTWVAQIEVESGSFEQLKANKEQLRTLMQSSGYTASAPEEKNIGGVDYITMQASYAGQNVVAGITKVNSMNFMAVTTLNQDNEFDYTILEKLASVVSSVTYNDATEGLNMKTDFDIKIDKIAKLAKEKKKK